MTKEEQVVQILPQFTCTTRMELGATPRLWKLAGTCTVCLHTNTAGTLLHAAYARRWSSATSVALIATSAMKATATTVHERILATWFLLLVVQRKNTQWGTTTCLVVKQEETPWLCSSFWWIDALIICTLYSYNYGNLWWKAGSLSTNYNHTYDPPQPWQHTLQYLPTRCSRRRLLALLPAQALAFPFVIIKEIDSFEAKDCSGWISLQFNVVFNLAC